MNIPGGQVKRVAWNLLDTDYDNYMVSYSCMDMMWDGMHWEYWSIYSKDSTTMSSEHYAAAEAAIYDNVPNTDINFFTKHTTNHWLCSYNWDLA